MEAFYNNEVVLNNGAKPKARLDWRVSRLLTVQRERKPEKSAVLQQFKGSNKDRVLTTAIQ